MSVSETLEIIKSDSPHGVIMRDERQKVRLTLFKNGTVKARLPGSPTKTAHSVTKERLIEILKNPAREMRLTDIRPKLDILEMCPELKENGFKVDRFCDKLSFDEYWTHFRF